MGLEQIIADLVQRVEQKYYGKYRGIVVENNDPKKLGRLKVKVPSVLGKEVVTGWAMPCVPYGGAENRGFFFIPEIKSGVWVEFEEGDLEFPIWSGTYWAEPGGSTEIPKNNNSDGNEESPGESPPARKIIKTEKGLTIQLEDANNQEMILIHNGVHNQSIVLNNNGITIRNGDVNSIVMDSTKICLKHSESEITIDNAAINITATSGEVKVKGGKVIVEGSPIDLNP